MSRSSRIRHERNKSGAWRTQPATEIQIVVLKKIANETGKTFSTTITRGEASDLITKRFATDPKSRRAHERAERKRRQLEAKLVNPAANWRFGDKQTTEQEQAELNRARRDGLEHIYMELEAWVRGHRALAANRSAGRKPRSRPSFPAMTMVKGSANGSTERGAA